MKNINIGILGLGNVGQGVIEILNENNNYISEKCQCNINIKKILVSDLNKKRDIKIGQEFLTTNADEIINNPDIDIVLELIGGIEPAKTYILEALKNGKHVISANKMCIADNSGEILKCANENNVMFKFEASVAGGIPIINEINTSLTANKIQSIVGIINGTTNYILTKMHQENCELDVALKEAQELGYAEADPTSDVENHDAMYKLKILSKLAYGYDPEEIYTEGITEIKKSDIDYAKEFGYVIKSLAIGKVTDNKLELRVHPAMIKKEHPLANINDSFNGLFIKGNMVGDIMLYGRGAGSLPTGSAVIADLISIIKNINNNIIEKHIIVDRGFELKSFDDYESKFYMRLLVRDELGVLAYITGTLAKNGINVLSMIQKESSKENAINLVIFTHKIKYGNMEKFFEEVKNNDKVVAIRNVVKVED